MTDTQAPPKPSPAADGFIASDSDNISLFPDQVTDNLMHTTIALGAELWTMRRRLFVLEAVLEKAGVTTADIESYQPSEVQTTLWAQERDLFIGRAFGALTRTGGANDKQIDRAGDL
jgi:hypothetical protein